MWTAEEGNTANKAGVSTPLLFSLWQRRRGCIQKDRVGSARTVKELSEEFIEITVL